MKIPYYKLLLSVLLIVGCASRPKIKNINILDGEISSGSITLKTEDIIKDCKKECVTFTISSDEWCDCMNQCSHDVFDKNKISLGNMEMRVYINECPSDKDSN